MLRTRAAFAMWEVVLQQAPAPLHRDDPGLAQHRCLTFQAVLTIVLLHKCPIMVAQHMRRSQRRHNVRRGRHHAMVTLVQTGKRGVWGQNRLDAIHVRPGVLQQPQGRCEPCGPAMLTIYLSLLSGWLGTCFGPTPGV